MTIFRSLIVFLLMVTASGAAFADPALVRIQDEDTTVYVLGTFHILPPEAEWRSAAVEAALQQSQAIYMEADVWTGGDQMMIGLVQTYGMNEAGVTLSSLLDANDWSSVSQYSASLNLPPEAIDPMRPWMASVTLAAVSAMARGYDLESGVDTKLFAEMTAEGRELRFFETAEQQIRLFADLPLEDQLVLLVEGVRQSIEMPDQMDALMNAWLAGDLEQLHLIGNEPLRASAPNLYASMFTARNEAWVTDLSELMGTPGVYFVAVGAGHLPGDDGVIELMRANGFDVVVN